MRNLQTLFATILLVLFCATTHAAEEQAVIVHLRLSNATFGTKAEVDELFKFEEKIATAVEGSHVGEHDGNEIGAGEFIIFCYGPNADRLFAVIEPILRKAAPSNGARVVIRYGKPGARETERLF